MTATLDVLMSGLIDYAGLFPPAGLGMREAILNYAQYQNSSHHTWLGRFVLPAARLFEFELIAKEMMNANTSALSQPWQLSTLIGMDLAQDLNLITEFNSRHASAKTKPNFCVDSIELKASSEGEISQAMSSIPTNLAAYFEISTRENPTPLIAAIANAGGKAKLRTGGITPELIPSSAQVARFILACHRAQVPFKATAGLHHPIRSFRSLTYEAKAPEAIMHGFLNVFLAAALASQEFTEKDAVDVLDSTTPHLSFHEDFVTLDSWSIPKLRLSEMRQHFALAFGSCSFMEPIEDLQQLELI